MNCLLEIKREILNFIKYDAGNATKTVTAPATVTIPTKRLTGRGHLATDQVDLCIELLRKKHPETVRIVDIAHYCNVSQSRAARLVDLLSGAELISENLKEKTESISDKNYDFLCYVDDDSSIGIFLDRKMGIT